MVPGEVVLPCSTAESGFGWGTVRSLVAKLILGMWVVVASLHSRGQTGLTPELMVNCMERSLQEEGAPAKSNRSSVAGLHWEMGLDCQSHFQWSLISYFYKCLTNTAFRVVQTFLELNTQRNNIPLKFLFPGLIWLFVNFTLVIVVFLF